LTTRADGDGLFSQSDYLGSYCSDVVRRVGDEAKGPIRSSATQITTAWFESFLDYLALERGSSVENKNEAAGNSADFSLKLKGNTRTDNRCVFNFGAADNVSSSHSRSIETTPGPSSGSGDHALTFSRSFAST